METSGGATVSFNEGVQYFLTSNLDLETAVLTTIGTGDRFGFGLFGSHLSF